MADDTLSEQARQVVLAAYGDPAAMPSAERLTAALGRLDAEVQAFAEQEAAGVAAPDADAVEQACAALRSAASAQADAERAADALSADRVQFLETSLEFRDRHGAQPCPVCAKSDLDDEWVTWARAALAAEQEVASALRVARSRTHRARQALTAIVRSVEPPPGGSVELTTIASARVAYESLLALPVDDDTALAGHVELVLPELLTAYGALREEAAAKLEITREAQTWLQTLGSTVQR